MSPECSDKGSILSVSGVSKSFGGIPALSGVDLEIRSSEVHALLGENGAGKSTLMKIVSGALSPDAGSLVFDGRPFKPADTAAARRAGICMIYQELALAPHLSVAENISLGTEPLRRGFIDRKKIIQTAKDALRELGHDDIDPGVRAGDLPPAARQITEIARSLVLGSRLIIMDEPSSSLGREECENLFRVISDLRSRGKSIIFISHNLEEVFRIAGRYSVLKDGTNAGGGQVSEASPQEILRMMAGREVSGFTRQRRMRIEEPVLKADRFRFSDRYDGVSSLTVNRGEILGIAGLMGSGRSAFLRAIFGLREIRGGSINFMSLEGAYPPRRRWAQGMGFVSEDRAAEGLAAGMSIADNILLAPGESVSLTGIRNPSGDLRTASELMDRLSIKAASPSQRAGELSGGNQQKVALARALHSGADLILLDEPTRGIDIRSRAEIYGIMDRFAEAGGAIIVVSSYIPELLALCDRIAVMKRCSLGPAREAAGLDEHAILEEAFGVNEAA